MLENLGLSVHQADVLYRVGVQQQHLHALDLLEDFFNVKAYHGNKVKGCHIAGQPLKAFNSPNTRGYCWIAVLSALGGPERALSRRRDQRAGLIREPAAGKLKAVSFPICWLASSAEKIWRQCFDTCQALLQQVPTLHFLPLTQPATCPCTAAGSFNILNGDPTVGGTTGTNMSAAAALDRLSAVAGELSLPFTSFRKLPDQVPYPQMLAWLSLLLAHGGVFATPDWQSCLSYRVQACLALWEVYSVIILVLERCY